MTEDENRANFSVAELLTISKSNNSGREFWTPPRAEVVSEAEAALQQKSDFSGNPDLKSERVHIHISGRLLSAVGLPHVISLP